MDDGGETDEEEDDELRAPASVHLGGCFETGMVCGGGTQFS